MSARSSSRMRRLLKNSLPAFASIAMLVVSVAPTLAQDTHDHQAQAEAPSRAEPAGVSMGLFMTRDASGTSWLPDATPMYGVMRSAGDWQLMFHGNAFAQYLNESGDRGRDQFGSINWIMLMARRELAGGRFGLRSMFSLEPWTIRGCGYPDLLASGEVCDGEAIHDQQHPHDLFMELAAEYDHALAGNLRWHAYGGLAGEPALGPVAYPHRVSSLPNPIAPISHHWLDATHISFGVVTAGVYGARWKAEGSVFNGREPDEHRKDFDLGALDSFSGRVWYLPSARLALQFSAGRLTEAETGEGDEASGNSGDVDRITASATYHRPIGPESIWASTVAWGQNREDDRATNALLAETNLTWQERHSLFGRFEVTGKTAHDLALPDDGSAASHDVFTVSKAQAGYTRYFSSWRHLQAGIGAEISISIVPASLAPVYGGRGNVGYGLFLTLRPAGHHM